MHVSHTFDVIVLEFWILHLNKVLLSMDVWIINGGCKSIFKSSSICLSLAKNENNPKKKTHPTETASGSPSFDASYRRPSIGYFCLGPPASHRPPPKIVEPQMLYDTLHSNTRLISDQIKTGLINELLQCYTDRSPMPNQGWNTHTWNL